jgi:hypothetical protein
MRPTSRHFARSTAVPKVCARSSIEQWFRYFQNVAAFPQMAVEGGDVREMIDFVNT